MRTLSLLVLITILMVIAGAGSAQAWDDLPYYTLSDYGITEAEVAAISDGISATTWGPYLPMTRAQFTKMAMEAFDVVVNGAATQTFSDVPPGHPFYGYIESAAQAGLIQGKSGGVFDPYGGITREQAVAVIARRQAQRANLDLGARYTTGKVSTLLSPFVDQGAVSIRQEMASGVEWGIVRGTGDGRLAPSRQLLRIQGAAMLIRSGRSLSDVDFVDADHGWAVGTDGLIMHSEDGGVSWVPQLPPTDLHVNEVHFFDQSEGFAGTALGLLLYTNDGGETWQIVRDDFGSFFGLEFFDRAHGWALDEFGNALRTTNGGLNWQPDAGMLPLLNDLSFVSATDGWIVGHDGYIGHSTDGGATWGPQTSGTTQNLRGIHMQSATTGWAVGDGGTVLATGDGTTWSPQSALAAANFHDVVSTSATSAWIVGAGGSILATGDGGVLWSPQSSGVTQDLYGLDVGDGSLFAFGWSAGEGSVILRSTDGSTWEVVFPAP